MANRVKGLSPEAPLDCFLSGLKDHIHRDVIAQDPKSLIHVEVKHLFQSSKKEIDIVQLGVVNQAELKLLLRTDAELSLATQVELSSA
ncbi:hypothetical protein Tco_0888683 [Tanacetum coccineum]